MKLKKRFKGIENAIMRSEVATAEDKLTADTDRL